MSLALYAYILIELIAVSWGDIKWRQIPNSWALLNFFVFVVLVFFGHGFSLLSFVYPLVFLSLGFLLFILNIMGGGDSKFLASFILLIPQERQEPFLIILLYTVILCAGSILCYNSFRNARTLLFILGTKEWSKLDQIYGKKIPFAPIILFAWLGFGYTIEIW